MARDNEHLTVGEYDLYSLNNYSALACCIPDFQDPTGLQDLSQPPTPTTLTTHNDNGNARLDQQRTLDYGHGISLPRYIIYE